MKKTKSTAGETIAKPGVGKVSKKPQAAKPAAADKHTADVSAVQEVKEKKRVRGSFSLPASDYALIDILKSAMKKTGKPVKKNDLLRAGLRALKAMPGESLRSAIDALKPEPKTARKKR